ncbi:hypothetical protein BZ164_00785, partial [Pseudomonas veronii]
RRRRSWPSSSPPLSLLLVINIPVCLSLIVRGKRCPVFHGARSAPIRQLFRLEQCKGGALAPSWALSLDFVPHLSGNEIKWC